MNTDPLNLGVTQKQSSVTLVSGVKQDDKAIQERMQAEQGRLKAAEAEKAQLAQKQAEQDKSMSGAIKDVQEFKPTDTSKEYNKLEQGLQLNLSKVVSPPKHQVLYKAKTFKELLPVLAALAALGTKASGGNIAVGINAFAKGLQGYKDGNEQEYNRQYKVYQDNMQEALKRNAEEIQSYTEWMRGVQTNDKVSLDKKIAVLKAMAAANRNVHMQQAANTNDIEKISSNIDNLAKAHARAQTRIYDSFGKLKPPVVTKGIRDAAGAILAADKSIPPLETTDENSNKILDAKVSLLRQKIESMAAHYQQEDPDMTPMAAVAKAQSEALKDGLYTPAQQEEKQLQADE